MTLPCGVTGSLRPAFAPVRAVALTVKLPCAFTLYGWFPFSLREPSRTSVTFLEATAPVKLPTRQCSRPGLRAWVRSPEQPGWYFNVGSAETGIPASKPPTYPTQAVPNFTAKLQ